MSMNLVPIIIIKYHSCVYILELTDISIHKTVTFMKTSKIIYPQKYVSVNLRLYDLLTLFMISIQYGF